ncbi:MAG: hypothetical protein U0V70_17470 [Terriglobia bacterium]
MGDGLDGAKYGTSATSSCIPPPSSSSTASTAANDALLTRITDLEAYINNTAPKALVNTPGPGSTMPS